MPRTSGDQPGTNGFENANNGGYDSTREIKSFRKDLPVIAITAYGKTKDEEKALEAGCDDYLAKPVTKEELFDKFRKYRVAV